MFPHVDLFSSFFKNFNPNNTNVHMRLMMKTSMNNIIKKEKCKDLNVESCWTFEFIIFNMKTFVLKVVVCVIWEKKKINTFVTYNFQNIIPLIFFVWFFKFHHLIKEFAKFQWRAPNSRGKTHLRVSQSQVTESWDSEARSRLPTLERGRGSSWEPMD
jgi:hypothetical protein